MTINDIAENECLRIGTAGDESWIGYIQPPGQAAVDAGWGWACDSSPLVNWSTSEPGDGVDGIEDGEEDCASIFGDGTWLDGPCNAGIPFVCELR